MRLTFCSNILPGTGFDEHFASLQKSIPKIKRASPWLQHLGLRLSEPMVSDLLQAPEKIERFNQWLSDHDLKISTVNIFPYGDFSEKGLKDKVYLPDWSSKERVEYTLRAAEVLNKIETTKVVSMSTVPLGYKPHYDSIDYSVFFENLTEALDRLKQLSKEKNFLLALEPEPDCLLECTNEAIHFFEQFKKVSTAENLGLCFDTCHFAVNFEDVGRSLFDLKQAGISIFKFQLSSALRWTSPLSIPGHKMLLDEVYLHQLRVRSEAGKVIPSADTPRNVDELNAIQGEWRCHFHTPIFAEDYHGFQSTQKEILDSIESAAQFDLEPLDFEVETYTWNVLPDGEKLRTVEECINRELEWVKPRIEKCFP